MRGVVKWFISNKGYGFIKQYDKEDDIFVHYSGIVGDGYRSLNEGDMVEYEIEKSERGPKAVNVRKV